MITKRVWASTAIGFVAIFGFQAVRMRLGHDPALAAARHRTVASRSTASLVSSTGTDSTPTNSYDGYSSGIPTTRSS
jgi:hypothetical protein